MRSIYMKLCGLMSAAALVYAMGAGPAQAQAVGTPIVAPPGGFLAGFATPLVVTQVGGTIVFVNLDIAPHKLCIVYAIGDDRCGAVVGTGGVATDTPTAGLTSGGMYEFYCEIHRNMRGTLVAV